jgi:exodeoxyribonuclease V gamma subunit
MEILVEALAEVVREPLADPLAAECILVQSRGIERWLSMELARRLQIWANPDFPFPRHFFERLFDGDGSKPRRRYGDPQRRIDPYDPAALAWSIADLLPRLRQRPEFAEVSAYLDRAAAAPPSGLAASTDFHELALAGRIATVLDQYVVYRPQWIMEWETGAGNHWQAILWRSLRQRLGPTHVAARAADFVRSLRDGTHGPLPERVSVFGLSTLPPLYLHVLNELAARIDVHLFLLSPSREYWAWIRSQREVVRRMLSQSDPSQWEAALQETKGNPLLASFGKVGRDFQQVLEATVDYQDDDRYHDPGSASVLTTLQADILCLRHRRPGNPDALPLPFPGDDESIRIHVCHSPMREVEVLHDQLLDLFERDRTLEARDVVVMSPSIDVYAPFIDAVFGSGHSGQPLIPYRIADRKLRATDDVIDTFLLLLATLSQRFTAPEIADLVTREPVRERFGIVAEEMDLLREWVRGAGIRWGVDAEHRAAVGQPPLEQNTWRFGLDRLLLGYAMTGDERQLFRGVLPYDDMEGTAAELLGKLVECCQQLFAFRQRAQEPRPIGEWRSELASLLAALLASNEATAHQHRRILQALEEIEEQATVAGFGGTIGLDSMRARLEMALESGAPGRAFLAGGVTFCAMVPMRSVPFRVVCLLGLNDDTFPRRERPLGFDRMAEAPLPGDRHPRDDDRQLFLEAVLSARERLLITYVGQSVRDNAEIPPSAVLSELLDAVDESFSGPIADDGKALPARQRLMVSHPLQAFSRRYFSGDAHLFSYSPQHRDGARCLVAERLALPPFVDRILPDLDERAVSIDELARFFERPLRAFLQRRLGLYLGDDVTLLDDRMPLDLDHLGRWRIGTRLLDWALEGRSMQAAVPVLHATGEMPPGTLGTALFAAIAPTAEALAHDAIQHMAGALLPPLHVDRFLGATRLTGSLTGLYPNAQVQYQYGKVHPKHEIGIWIRHLVLNWVGGSGLPQHTVLVGRGEKGESAVACFVPVLEAERLLAELLELYWLGQRLPLPLFAEASYTYVETLRAGGPADKAVAAARKVFTDEKGFGDRPDIYLQQIFAQGDPLQAEWIEPLEALGVTFESVALRVIDPLLRHRREGARTAT